MLLGDQHGPLLARLTERSPPRVPVDRIGHDSRFAVRVGARIRGVPQHGQHASVGGPFPDGVFVTPVVVLGAVLGDGQFEIALDEPEQSLPRAPQLEELREDRGERMLESTIGILLDATVNLEIADGDGDQ